MAETCTVRRGRKYLYGGGVVVAWASADFVLLCRARHLRHRRGWQRRGTTLGCHRERQGEAAGGAGGRSCFGAFAAWLRPKAEYSPIRLH